MMAITDRGSMLLNKISLRLRTYQYQTYNTEQNTYIHTFVRVNVNEDG
jgi:hypothetical protein